TKQEIKNVIKVTNKYDKELDRVQIDEQDILSDHVSALIEELKENGVEVTDTAEIPENKNSEQVFKLHEIPEAFEIEHLTLTMHEIKNVIKVTNKYDKELDRVQIDEQDILSDHVSALIEELKENGVEVTDTAEIPENKNSEQVFKLHEIPEAFEIEHLTLTMPDKDRFDFSGSEAEETITLPSNEEGEFEVELTLKLKEEY